MAGEPVPCLIVSSATLSEVDVTGLNSRHDLRSRLTSFVTKISDSCPLIESAVVSEPYESESRLIELFSHSFLKLTHTLTSAIHLSKLRAHE